MSFGIASFVKTPGVTPLKTRLAATIGANEAELFYKLSCDAVFATVVNSSMAAGDQAYWAVTENSEVTKEYWRSLPLIEQGEGTLGERLANVYDTLLSKHDIAVIVGSDCPQITSSLVKTAVEIVKSTGRLVMGPASDGGFYLFAFNKELDRKFFTSVKYSAVNTRKQILVRCQKRGIVVELMRQLTDVDVIDDINLVATEFHMMDALTPEQAKINKWCEKYGS